MRCFARFAATRTILKNVKNADGGVLIFSGRNFTKSNTSPWVLFRLLKFYQWYQVVQSITYLFMDSACMNYSTLPRALVFII